jgi:hypothetical protein
MPFEADFVDAFGPEVFPIRNAGVGWEGAIIRNPLVTEFLRLNPPSRLCWTASVLIRKMRASKTNAGCPRPRELTQRLERLPIKVSPIFQGRVIHHSCVHQVEFLPERPLFIGVFDLKTQIGRHVSWLYRRKISPDDFRRWICICQVHRPDARSCANIEHARRVYWRKEQLVAD